ncbi:hypothetical protein SA496_11215 [Pseudomonas sp. JS3066]|nr:MULTISPECIES: hypothetical protein [unclassified Pseudomonas]WVK95705.1 hypothetical protein SA496_11215 [Pseudomonas sp. JS3066]
MAFRYLGDCAAFRSILIAYLSGAICPAGFLRARFAGFCPIAM